MQGWRVQMEDAHFALAALDGGAWQNVAAFGVMDGHGGKEVARFCERHLPEEIVRGSSADPHGALVAAFQRMDELLVDREQSAEELRELSGEGGLVNPDWVGCTCVVCLLEPEAIIVANCGDSRAVLSRRRKALPLSEDHKPNLPVESERIHLAGGTVERRQVGTIVQYRVNGNLNLSRSIGDLEYKKNTALPPSGQMISATPDVQSLKREAGDEFLIVACDGIWDVMDNQEVVDFVHERLPQQLKSGRPLSGIMEELMDHCISPDLSTTNGLGGDNMTAMIVLLEAPKPALGSTVACTESEAPVSSMANVEDGSIQPTGLCGCRTDASK